MRTDWLSCLVGAVIALLVAILIPPFVPEPGGVIVAIVGYVAAVLLFILSLLGLVRGRGL